MSEIEQSHSNTVIIDNGSGYCKAGLSTDEFPTVNFRAVVGRPKESQIMLMTDDKPVYIGEEAQAKKGILRLTSPIEHGIINSWDDMQKIWYHCYENELRVHSNMYPALLTEAPMNPKINREKMIQTFFDDFDVPKFYLGIQAVLSLYSSGRTTGIVLDSGDGVTHTVPVFEGYSLPHAIKRENFAGRDLSDYMINLLTEIGLSMHSSSEREIARQIKEKFCYVAYDFKNELKTFEETSKEIDHTLPDGTPIKLGNQVFRCTEALFNPFSQLGKEILGVHDLVTKSIKDCDIDTRRDLYQNILVSGGNTMFEGFGERLHKEIAESAPSTIKIKVVTQPDRKYSVWCGGSVLSSLSTFQTMLIGRDEYEETGSSIVHRKCF